MADTDAADLDGAITEFSERLRTLIRTAADLRSTGVSMESVADDVRITDQFWHLGLAGARLDELMKSQVGLHAPVMATYDAVDAQGPDDRESSGDAEVEDRDDVAQVIRLEFVLRSRGGRSSSDLVTLVDEAGQRLFDMLTAEGCDIPEWGSTIQDYDPGDAD